MRKIEPIDKIEIEIEARSNSAKEGIDALAASLQSLRTAAKGGIGLTTVTRQLTNFAAAVDKIKAPTQKIQALADSLKPLETIGKSNLGSTLNQLKKIPDITAALDSEKLRDFAGKIQEVTLAVAPLATEMEKVSQGFSKLPANIQRAINANAKLTKSNTKTAFSFNMMAAKIGIIALAARKVGRVLSGWINESTEYVENLNLFTITMGENMEQAKKYAEEVGDAVGIDPSEFMRYQAVFQNMTMGFGIAADKASIMSKNLTTLGYDLASVFNVKFETAMQKLESALAGQPRPMREWGFDLSEATLKAVALEKGISKNVETMVQMEKAQIRYIQLIETAQKLNLTGNFSRELITTANQIRVFQAQVKQAARALGNIFIPALNAVLPYMIAFLKVVRTVANEIANLFGFALPPIDYSGLNSLPDTGEDIEDSLDGATDAANELKRAVAGFDELNILNFQKDTGIGADGEALNIDLPEYDFLKDLVENRVNNLAEKLEKPFKEILEIVGTIGAGMALWKIGSSVVDFLSWMKENAKGGKIALGVTLAVTGFTLAASGFYNIGKGDADILDYIKASVGSVLGIAGSLLFFGTSPVGLAISIAAALTVAIVSIYLGTKKRISEMVADAFADSTAGGASPQEIIDAFKEYYNNQFGDKNQLIIQLGVEVKSNRADLAGYIDDLKTIDTYLFGEKRPTEAEIEYIKKTWDSINDKMKTVFQQDTDIILAGFTQSFSDAAASIGLDAAVMRAQFLMLNNNMSATSAVMTAEMENLSIKIALGTADEKDLDRYNLLKELLNETSENTQKAQKELAKFLDDIEKIDLGDVSKATEFITNFKDVALKLIEENESAYTTLIESTRAKVAEAIRQNKAGYLDEAEFIENLTLYDDLMEAFELTYNQQEDDIKKKIDEIFGKIQDQLVSGAAEVANEALAEWEGMSGWKKQYFKQFGIENADEYVRNALEDYKTNIVTPILTGENGIQKQMDALGIEGGLFAGEALETILSSLFDVTLMPSGMMPYLKIKFKKNISQDTIDLLKSYGVDMSDFAQTIGTDIIEGIQVGAETEVKKPKKWYDIFGWIKYWCKDTYEINSPSQVFADIGGNLMQGLANGMSGWDDIFKNIFKKIVNIGIDIFNKFIDWINEKLNISWDAVKVLGQTIVPAMSFQLFTIPKIPRLAAGAVIPPNKEFIATLGDQTSGTNIETPENLLREIYREENGELVGAVYQMAKMIVDAINDKDTTLELDGETISKSVISSINDYTRRTGRNPINAY